MEHKNIILFVGNISSTTIDDIRQYEKEHHKKFRVALLYDSKKKKPKIQDSIDIVLSCDMGYQNAIAKTLLPYEQHIVAVTARGDKQIPIMQKVIPQLPYIHTPTVKSLDWATQKIIMRNMFSVYDKTITPEFTVVHDAKKVTLKAIEEKVGFPVVVKPAGLVQSLLVSVCFHREELEKTLRSVFRKLRSQYKEHAGRGVPSVLVEQFMEGEMYSVDAYVRANGIIDFCPMVHVKTGRSIGFDDFFGYQQTTPTTLNKDAVSAAEDVATKAIHALKLRSSTAHVELLHTDNGWKVIEIGPRIGGFRHYMYSKSFDINHTMNDILIRTSEKVHIPKKVQGYTTVMKFFAKQEGILTKLNGIKKAQELKSFCMIKINKKVGDRCLFAKNGGKSVFNITLFNKERSALLADIRRLEQTIKIETRGKKKA